MRPGLDCRNGARCADTDGMETTFQPMHEAATMAGVSIRTVQRWASAGRIESKDFGGQRFVKLPPDLVQSNRPDALLVEAVRAQAAAQGEVAADVSRSAESTAIALQAVSAKFMEQAAEQSKALERAERRSRWAFAVAGASVVGLAAYVVGTSVSANEGTRQPATMSANYDAAVPPGVAEVAQNRGGVRAATLGDIGDTQRQSSDNVVGDNVADGSVPYFLRLPQF